MNAHIEALLVALIGGSGFDGVIGGWKNLKAGAFLLQKLHPQLISHEWCAHLWGPESVTLTPHINSFIENDYLEKSQEYRVKEAA